MSENAARLARKYLLSTTVAVAGVNPVTFNAWRNRNGLFPRTKDEQGWKYYSFADICVTAMVRRLTASGINTAIAVRLSMALMGRFEQMVLCEDDDVFENTIAVFRPTKDEDGGFDIFFASPEGEMGPSAKEASFGIAIVIDLYAVFKQVIDGLKALEPETVLTGDEAHKSILAAFANSFADSLARIETEEQDDKKD